MLVFILVRLLDEVSRLGPRQRGDVSEAGEWAGGSIEASSAAPDLITSDRSFISQPLCSQQPQHGSEDTAQTHQPAVKVAKHAAGTQCTCHVYKQI